MLSHPRRDRDGRLANHVEHFTEACVSSPAAVRKELADLEGAGQGSGERYNEIVFSASILQPFTAMPSLI